MPPLPAIQAGWFAEIQEPRFTLLITAWAQRENSSHHQLCRSTSNKLHIQPRLAQDPQSNRVLPHTHQTPTLATLLPHASPWLSPPACDTGRSLASDPQEPSKGGFGQICLAPGPEPQSRRRQQDSELPLQPPQAKARQTGDRVAAAEGKPQAALSRTPQAWHSPPVLLGKGDGSQGERCPWPDDGGSRSTQRPPSPHPERRWGGS